MFAYGAQSMIAPLRSVLVRRPDAAFGRADPGRWHYGSPPDLAVALQEHQDLVSRLQAAGCQVFEHDAALPDHADAIFVFDPAIVTDAGAVILRMGKSLRRGEEAAMARRLTQLGIPIHYSLSLPAVAEGGDLLWIDPQTLAVGQGFRTNREGLRQLETALAPLGVQVVPVELPYYQGPEACLHLLSLISLVDEDLAVCYLPLLATPFVELLRSRGIRLLEVPNEEFATQAPNVLALAPGECLMLAGNPVTQERLVQAGCRVQTYLGREISLKAEGGPTCLTRPLWRSN